MCASQRTAHGFLDNVGFAKAGLAHDLGINDAAYGLGAGIFFIGYVLLEIPSNAGMHRFGARKWLSRILVSWGVLATAMALVVVEGLPAIVLGVLTLFWLTDRPADATWLSPSSRPSRRSCRSQRHCSPVPLPRRASGSNGIPTTP